MARRLAVSTQGRALFAIREDEVAAEAMGVDTTGYKVRAFVISAAYAGLAGALISHAILLATPRMFTFVRSIEVVVMVVLGGLGSITGSVLAAVVLTIAARAAARVPGVPDGGLRAAAHRADAHRPQGIFGTRELVGPPVLQAARSAAAPRSRRCHRGAVSPTRSATTPPRAEGAA